MTGRRGLHANTCHFCLLLFGGGLPCQLPAAGGALAARRRSAGPAGGGRVAGAAETDRTPEVLYPPVCRAVSGTALDGGLQRRLFWACPGAGRAHRPPVGYCGRLASINRLRILRLGPGGYRLLCPTVRDPLFGRTGGGPAPRGPDLRGGPRDPGRPDLLRGGDHLLHRQGHFSPGQDLRRAGAPTAGANPAPVLAGGAVQVFEAGH